ncbi:Putative lipid-binding protein AIR1B [Linum grandiflorum]
MASSSKTATVALALFLSLNLLVFSATKVTATTCNPANLTVCVDLLGHLLNIRINKPASEPCCSLFNGVVDLDAAVCVCLALKNNLLAALGLPLINLTPTVSVLLNGCGRSAPLGYTCL